MQICECDKLTWLSFHMGQSLTDGCQLLRTCMFVVSSFVNEVSTFAIEVMVCSIKL